MADVKIKWRGEEGFEEYHGSDGDAAVDLVSGQEATVSKEKADQLASDFPHLVSVGGKAPAKKPKPAAQAEPEAEADEAAEPEAEAE